MSKKKRHNSVVFKPYVQNQQWLFPPSLDQMIPATHKVRLINDVVEGMDLSSIIATYKGGGTSSYHPKMLLKVVIYGYSEKIYSSRKLEKALHENICFMWLAGLQQPDHHVLNTFRRHRLDGSVKDVFKQVLLLLVEQGYVKLEDYHLDGTKMESVANRYSFVWAKNVSRYKASVLAKINALVEQIESANEAAEQQDQVGDSQEVLAQGEQKISDSEALAKTIEQINQTLSNEEQEDKSKKKKRKLLKKLQQDYQPKLKQYEEQQAKLGDRSSYSKTDEDATFMRTKDDHLGKGQLKPNYNAQVGTEAQFIINYTLHQTPSDSACFKQHLEDTLDLLEQASLDKPKNVVADAGYGTEENYELLEKHQVQAYVKYPGFYRERNNKFKNPFDQRTLYYNEQEDYFVCPMGQRMQHVGQSKRTAASGYEQQLDHYQAQRCEDCPLRGVCFKADGNRMIQLSHKLRKHRSKASQKLKSLKGIRKRQRRNTDVEAVFGHIKQCRGFRRFMLRSLEGVRIEMGLLSIANNFIKWHKLRLTKLIELPGRDPSIALSCSSEANSKPRALKWAM